MRVLLIEDEPKLAALVVRMLRKLLGEPVVTIVDTADAAIELLAAQADAFDLVLSDYDLRSGTGGDVLEWARSAMPALLDRFVFQSGNDLVEQLHSRFVMKPYTHAELGAVLAGVLS